MSQPSLLLVEDEPQMRQRLCELLEAEGFEVVAATNAGGMRRLLGEGRRFDLLILDLVLPDVDGLVLLREYERNHGGKVLVATVRDTAQDRAACFNAGATDVLVKPFLPIELVRRVRNTLELPQALHADRSRSIAIGTWRFQPDAYRLVDEAEHSLELSPLERDLLLQFSEARGRVLARELLTENFGLKHPKSLDVAISKLRKKIERDPTRPELIRTVPGVGYQLNCAETH